MQPISLSVHERGSRFPARGDGRVFSVHQEALNLHFDASPELVTLVARGDLMTVTSLLLGGREGPLRFDSFGPPAGSLVTIEQRRITFDSELELELRSEDEYVFSGAIESTCACLRRAGPAGGGVGRAHPGATGAAVTTLREELAHVVAEIGSGRGFSPLVSLVYEGSPPDDPFCGAAWEVVALLLARAGRDRAGAGHDGAGPRAAVPPGDLLGELAPLVGLGSGLTPSGDDFLVGVLAARAWLGAPAPPAPTVARILDRCAGTTLPGATIVRQALDGAFPAYLCTFARELSVAAATAECAGAAGGKPTARTPGSEGLPSVVRNATVRAARHGHSSGIDAVTGFVFGLALCGYARNRSAVLR